MKIVLAYSGITLPKHHMANLSMLKRNFPELDVVTIVDSAHAHLQLVKAGELSFLVSHLSRFDQVRARLSHDPQFWKGFWFLTIKRFFLIKSFMEVTGVSEVLHVESDVALMPNFPFQTFVRLNCELAYPLVDDQHAAASIMYIKDIQAIDKLIDFIDSDCLNHDDTDMKILAKYSKGNSRVLILPSKIDRKSLEYKSHEFFEGIFDGATYGQFLFGLDPRNNMGKRTLFMPLLNHHAQSHKYRYKVSFMNQGYSLLVIDEDGSEYPLYNLHIHSKDLRVFCMDVNSPSLLIQRCKQATQGSIKNEFLLGVFVGHLPSIVKSIPHLFYRRFKDLIMRKGQDI